MVVQNIIQRRECGSTEHHTKGGKRGNKVKKMKELLLLSAHSTPIGYGHKITP